MMIYLMILKLYRIKILNFLKFIMVIINLIKSMGNLITSDEEHQYTNDQLVSVLKQYIDIHNQMILLINQKKHQEFEYKFALFNINEVIAEINLIHKKIWNTRNKEISLFYEIQKIFSNFDTPKNEKFIKLNNTFQLFRDIHSHISILPYEYIEHSYTKNFIKMAEEYSQT